MPENPIDRSLERIDSGEAQRAGTMREVRPEFGRNDVARPMSGATALERLKTRFSASRPPVERDQARSQTRR